MIDIQVFANHLHFLGNIEKNCLNISRNTIQLCNMINFYCKDLRKISAANYLLMRSISKATWKMLTSPGDDIKD